MDFLKDYARSRNLSLEALGDQIGISRQYMAMIASEGANPSLEVCLKINKITGITVTVKDGVIQWASK